MNQMQVAKWGNSLAVRLPKKIVEALALQAGDNLKIEVVGARSLEVEKEAGLEDLLARVNKLRGSLPADFKFDRLDANER
jgi:antitoxin MazE